MVMLKGKDYNAADLGTNFGHKKKTQAGADGVTRDQWENLWVDGIAEMDDRKNAVTSLQQQATASATTSAADRQAVAADRQAVATDRAATQALVGQAQAARDGAAADRVLAQSFVGTATDVRFPAINYRLASAWDGTGQPTAYTLSGVVAVHRYDTRLDWDSGRWRKGKLARASSWWNETLNTATRGARKEFPVVALIVATATQVIIYDQHDLDANASPRMWMVFNKAGGIFATGQNYQCVFAAVGRLFIGAGPASAGMFVANFTADELARRHNDSNLNGVYTANIAARNTSTATIGTKYTSILVDGIVNSVHARVLPGAPLDPVSRLPVPTIAVATAGGTSVIHPTGLVANVTAVGGHARCALTNNELWMYRRPADDGRGLVYRMPIPYASGGSPTVTYAPGSTPGLLVATAAHTPAFARWSEGWARGGDTGLTIVADDPANPANSMYANVTKDFATGWMPGDTRLCAITEGAGSNGASGGNIFTAGNNGAMDNIAGFATVNASLASTSGELVVTSVASGSAVADSTYTVTAGVPLTVEFTYRRGTSGGNVLVQVTDGTSGAAVLAMAQSTSTSNVTDRLTITPSGVQITVRLFHSATAAGQTAFFDTVSVRRAGTFSDALIGTGELIVNGDGSSAAGWSSVNATPSVSGGELVATSTVGGGLIFERFTTTPGQAYLVTGTYHAGTSSAARVIATGVSTVEVSTSSAVAVPFCFQFIAGNSGTTDIQLATGTAGTAYFKVSCKLAVPDRSYKGRGLIPVGTLTRTPAATGSDLYMLSGFYPTAYLEQPPNPDLAFGTSDFFIRIPISMQTGTVYIRPYEWAYYTAGAYSGAGVRIYASDGGVNFQTSLNGFSTYQGASTSIGIPVGTAFLTCVRRTTGGNNTFLEIWINDTLVASSQVTLQDMTNANATLRSGYYLNGSQQTPSVGLGLLRSGAYAPTPAQIREMFADEAPLFQPNSKAFLGGASNNVQALALDEETGVLAVGTADGVSQFAGLRRVGRLTQAAGTAFAVSSVTNLSAGGGALLIGTASEAGIVTDLQPIKDELRQRAQPANSNDIVFEVTTTGAAPAVLGKLFVNEGESLLLDIDVQGVEASLTLSVACSYSIKGRVQRNYGGNVTLPTAPLKIILDSTNTALDVGLSADAAVNAASIAVTGLIGKTVTWRGTVRINRIGGVNAVA